MKNLREILGLEFSMNPGERVAVCVGPICRVYVEHCDGLFASSLLKVHRVMRVYHRVSNFAR